MPCASGADEGESAFQRREEHLNAEYSSQRFERQSATFLAEIRAGEHALEPARSGFKCQFCYLLAGSLTHQDIGFLTGNMSPEWTNVCQAPSVWLLGAFLPRTQTLSTLPDRVKFLRLCEPSDHTAHNRPALLDAPCQRRAGRYPAFPFSILANK